MPSVKKIKSLLVAKEFEKLSVLYKNDPNIFTKPDQFKKSVSWYIGADDLYDCMFWLLEKAPSCKGDLVKGILSEGKDPQILSSFKFSKDEIASLDWATWAVLVVQRGRNWIEAYQQLMDPFVETINTKKVSLLKEHSNKIIEGIVKTSYNNFNFFEGLGWVCDYEEVSKRAVLYNNKTAFQNALLHLNHIDGIYYSDGMSLLTKALSLNKSIASDIMKVVDVNQNDKAGNNPLFLAVASGHIDWVVELLKFGASPLVRSGKNKQGADALRLAQKSTSQITRQHILSLLEKNLLDSELKSLLLNVRPDDKSYKTKAL